MRPSARRSLGLGVSALLSAFSATALLTGHIRRGHRLGMAAATAFLAPTLMRNCSWWGPVQRHFPTENREVWLTIDDGPDPDETPPILDVLGKFEAKATFFCIGRRVAEEPALARTMAGAGHDLQNHTFSHPASTFWAASPRRAHREIELGSAAIRDATGREPTLFRAPAGLANGFVHAAAEHARLSLVGWSAAGCDGIPHDPDAVIGRILAAVQPGCIILLHENRLPGIAPGQRAVTLRKLLAALANRGLQPIIP